MDTTEIKPVAYYGKEKKKLGEQADGSTFGYEDIDRERLSAFALERGGEDIIVLHLDDKDKRLIWRKRVFKTIAGTKNIVHLLGWQKTVNGENVQSIAYIFEDGKIHFAGKFRKNHPILDEIKLTKEENGNI